jgi:hypothetical protein
MKVRKKSKKKRTNNTNMGQTFDSEDIEVTIILEIDS